MLARGSPASLHYHHRPRNASEDVQFVTTYQASRSPRQENVTMRLSFRRLRPASRERVGHANQRVAQRPPKTHSPSKFVHGETEVHFKIERPPSGINHSPTTKSQSPQVHARTVPIRPEAPEGAKTRELHPVNHTPMHFYPLNQGAVHLLSLLLNR